MTANKTKIKRTVWSEDERELIAIEITEIFKRRGVAPIAWTVTDAVFMQAQLNVIPEGRVRKSYGSHEVVESQTRVNRLRAELLRMADAEAAANYREIHARHGKTPEDLIAELIAANGSLDRKLEEAEARALSLQSRVTFLEEENSRLRAGQPVLAEPVKPVEAEPNSLLAKKRVKFLVLAVHVTAMQKALIDSLGDVHWVEPNDKTHDVRKLAESRHAIVITGQASSDAIRVCREKALSFHQVPGPNAVERAMREVIERSKVFV